MDTLELAQMAEAQIEFDSGFVAGCRQAGKDIKNNDVKPNPENYVDEYVGNFKRAFMLAYNQQLFIYENKSAYNAWLKDRPTKPLEAW